MNRLVREHYPVSKLPEDLREGFEGRGEVTITIETDPENQGNKGEDSVAAPSSTTESWVERGLRVRQPNFGSSQEVDAYVRSLRE